ncbi:MAG: hypothetical protein K0V04_05995 [Deltaproteobacteria bacterium]|nr:hypothetical protein [Deltaproteobacteria bacterium]
MSAPLTTIKFDDDDTLDLTATIKNGKVTSVKSGSQSAGTFEDDDLSTSKSVTLNVAASDGETSLSGTYTASDGTDTPFSTNNAVTISQDFTAPSRAGQQKQFTFTVSVSGSREIDDPTLILKTKSSDGHP